ncbi:MAG TPA: hypothetical protein VNQ77_10925 [Frankiaceae bacterium]|nr:hypothetical protein [Frankiaceae bacterium]
MIRKATLLTGFAAGYVLGAKAGRARYELIMKQWRGLLGKPEVQQATETVKQETSDLLGTAKRVVTDTFAGKDVTDKVHTTTTPDVTVRV